MKILSAAQIREADLYTISHEPIDSIALMERAAWAFVRALLRKYGQEQHFAVVAGNGNNGGDGLAIARILIGLGYQNTVCYLIESERYSTDNNINRQRLLAMHPGTLKMASHLNESDATDNTIWIDALFGTGIARKPEGESARLIRFLNSRKTVVSVDLPSGMYCDEETEHDTWVKADYTITFQLPKAGLLIPSQRVDFEVCDIGLDAGLIAQSTSQLHWITSGEISASLLHRERHSHKGTYGHLLLVAGSAEKPGAACLATMAALRSGCGLTTTMCPEAAIGVILQHAPEAMALASGVDFCTRLPENIPFTPSCIAAGPGLGTKPETAALINSLLERFPEIPVVLDADALNLIALGLLDLRKIRKRSLLTPHPGEFQRLVGGWHSEAERIAKLRAFAAEHEVRIILKGTWSVCCEPQGDLYYLTRGNEGMARGGSGDILTGLLGGLLARGYRLQNAHAATTAMYLHALAGEMAALELGTHGMKTGEIIPFLAKAWQTITAERVV